MASTTVGSCSVVGREPLMKYEGQVMRTFGRGDEYASFLGIPFAAHPEGLMRYQGAKSFTPVTIPGQSIPLYKADVTGKMCTQFDAPPNYEGSTDCLYLNVFLPRDPSKIEELLPVLVYIHGGGFLSGSNSETEISPDFIVQQELIFVTINYRLGVFGFLNMRSKECPGNAGLKDQVKALEWIRDNIESFKGDPKNVTLSGNSAGGTCVNMHLISPTSKGLFHKAIVQSGGIYCPWGYRGHQRRRKQALSRDPEFLRLLLAPHESKELQECAATLLKADRKARHPKTVSPMFGPTVEKGREGAFMADEIEEMMEQADLIDIPVMAGITKEEGITEFIGLDTQGIYKKWTTNDQEFRQFLMDNLRWSAVTANTCLQEIRNRYFPNQLRISAIEKDRCLANFLRDLYFRRFYDNFKFGLEKTLPKNLYVYRFDHVCEMSEARRQNMISYNDATHGDELNYLYCPKILKLESEMFIYKGQCQNKEIEQVMNHMCSLWANFCRSGVPKSDSDLNNVEWRGHTEENPCFLSISKNLRLIEEPLYKEEWAWLNAIVKPQPTVESPAVTPE